MGIAAVFITIFHSYNMINLDGIYYGIVEMFNIGVEIFLLMSGISLYFAYEKKPKFKDYYIKRILNVYLIGLICSIPYTIFTNLIIENNGIVAFIKGLGGISFILGDDHQNWYTIFIMVMYLVYPLIYKTLKFLQKKKLDLPVTLIVCIIWIALCFLMNSKFRTFYDDFEVAITRVPVFLIGCYFGKFVYEKKRFTIIEPIIMILFIFIYGVYRFIFNDSVYSYLTSINAGTLIINRFPKLILSISLLFILLLFAVVVRIKFIHKIFEFIGGLSLELYIIHVMGYNCLLAMGKSGLLYYICDLAVSFVLSIFLSKLRKLLVSKYVEKLKIKEMQKSSLSNTN